MHARLCLNNIEWKGTGRPTAAIYAVLCRCTIVLKAEREKRYRNPTHPDGCQTKAEILPAAWHDDVVRTFLLSPCIFYHCAGDVVLYLFALARTGVQAEDVRAQILEVSRREAQQLRRRVMAGVRPSVRRVTSSSKTMGEI